MNNREIEKWVWLFLQWRQWSDITGERDGWRYVVMNWVDIKFYVQKWRAIKYIKNLLSNIKL